MRSPGAHAVPEHAELACISVESVSRWRDGRFLRQQDSLAVELPVALEFNGQSHAVMLATPCELESFALGFALSEGIVHHRSEFHHVHVEETSKGMLVHCEIAGPAFMRLRERRRNLAGRTGCGLCGVESLEQAIHDVPAVTAAVIDVAAMRIALDQMASGQLLNRETGGMHAAAWSTQAGRLLQVCEDVGRHNALDKLIGKMAAQDMEFAKGFLLITSRASVEMVQKAAMAGIAGMVAISAPTALAVSTAQAANMTLVAFARRDGFVAYTHAERITAECGRELQAWT